MLFSEVNDLILEISEATITPYIVEEVPTIAYERAGKIQLP